MRSEPLTHLAWHSLYDSNCHLSTLGQNCNCTLTRFPYKKKIFDLLFFLFKLISVHLNESAKMASKGKGKEKLKKKDLTVGCKVINVEAFAYDVFVYSANKFGIPEECFSRWEGVTNDYGCDNFIAVMTRLVFRLQIFSRHDWYKLFKGGYESNKFQSFGEIKSALPRILHDTVDVYEGKEILQRFLTSLAVINELILFLYTENCGLYLKELAKFFWAFWIRDKKAIEGVPFFEHVYISYNNRKEESVEVFLNQFIPAHCIPYSEMSVKDIFINEYNKFFKVPRENLEEKKRKKQAEASRQTNLIRALQFQAETFVYTPERDEASAIDIPRNPGLGIRGHEAVLRNAFETDDATSLQNLPSTSQETESERRWSTSQKRKQKKKTSSCSSIEDPERLNIGLLEIDAATSHQNVPSTSRQETVRNRSETSSQKEEQKKAKSPYSGEMFGMFRQMDISLASAQAPTSPQNLPSISRQETVRNRSETSSQKEEEKKATSRSREEESEQSIIGLPEASAATSLQNLPSTTEKKKSKKKRKK